MLSGCPSTVAWVSGSAEYTDNSVRLVPFTSPKMLLYTYFGKPSPGAVLVSVMVAVECAAPVTGSCTAA